MYIRKVAIRNIRGFETLDFDLMRPDSTYAGWTVFTGDNGSGKSTLLKAIAVCLTGRDTARALQPSFNGWTRQGAVDGSASIQLDILRVEEADELGTEGAPPAKGFPAKLTFENGGKEIALHSAIPAGKPKSYKLPDRTIWSSAAGGWFSCGYGPFRRIFGASSEATQIMVAATTARFATMFSEAASLSEAARWLQELHHKQLERKSEGAQLEILLQILKDEFLPNQLTIQRVDSDGLWLVDRNGVELAWGEMSDGYRAALALLTDIIRHLINAYGVHDLVGTGADQRLFIKRGGVVLIDEIDAHLHPEWQQKIGFWLKRHFPNIQFLVTTHSPIICQAADPNGLFVLPEPGSNNKPCALSDQDYRKVIASRPDTILLTPAFGLQNTRSQRAVDGRAEYARLQAKKRATGELTSDEQKRELQDELFAMTDEEI